jgi:hypothetical protein
MSMDSKLKKMEGDDNDCGGKQMMIRKMSASAGGRCGCLISADGPKTKTAEWA